MVLDLPGPQARARPGEWRLQLIAGRKPYDRTGPWDVDAHNARVLAENRGRAADAFRRLVGAVEAASDADLEEAGLFPWLENGQSLWATVFGDSIDHYPDHVPHPRG